MIAHVELFFVVSDKEGYQESGHDYDDGASDFDESGSSDSSDSSESYSNDDSDDSDKYYGYFYF